MTDEQNDDRLQAFEDALKACEQASGINSLEYADKLEQYAKHLRLTKVRLLDAANMLARAKVIKDGIEAAVQDVKPAQEVDQPEQSEATNKLTEDERACPYCAEIIKAAAIKCRYCGEFLPSKIPFERETSGKDKTIGDLITGDTAKKSGVPNRFANDRANKLTTELKTAIAHRNFVVAVSLLPTKQQAAYQAEVDRRRRSAGVSYVLCVLVGIFGAHKFYLGDAGWGIIYLFCTIFAFFTLFFSLLIPLCGLFFDLFLIPGQVETANDRIRQEILYEIVNEL